MKIALKALSYLPPHALVGHVRRRVRNKTVPKRAAAYRAELDALAETLPPIAAEPSPGALRAAETVATFQRAKNGKNVPQCLDGTFTFLNRTYSFGGADKIDWWIANDEGEHNLWRANLAYMAYLCPLMEKEPEAGLAFAARLIRSFLATARFERGGEFAELWHPYAASQRTLGLTAALVRLPRSLVGGEDWNTVERFVRLQAAFLLRNLETELGVNHLERNCSALAIYALAAGPTPAPVKAALDQTFPAVIRDSFGDDGGQLERCPMYQGLSVQSLRIFRELGSWSAEQRALIERRLPAVERAYAALTLGDGQPSMMNDGWFDEAPPVHVAVPDQPRPGFLPLPDAGYVRLADGDAVALFDAGPIGVDYNPGHGHADFLSFELSLGEDRLIVDPGTLRYSAGPERNLTRAWRSHNGPAVLGAEPVEYAGAFKVGRRAAARLVSAQATPEAQTAEGAFDFAGAAVTRRVTLRPGAGLEVVDTWRRGEGERQVRLLIPDFWKVVSSTETAIEFEKDGRRVTLAVEGGRYRLGRAVWSRRYNVGEDAHEIIAVPTGATMTQTLSWNPGVQGQKQEEAARAE